MIEAYNEQENDQFQLITLNGDSVIDVNDVSVLSGNGNERVQFITLEEAQAKGWGVQLAETAPSPQINTVEINTPIIEEENSSDNFPAIGHLENFEIQQADDGTLLPSTVNAKMADGSYQRLTLFPQVVDGNLTCVVQFENDSTETPQSHLQETLSEKIDSIICQNEGIIANSKLRRPLLRPKDSVSLLKSSYKRPVHIPIAKKVPAVQSHQISRNSPFHFPVNDVLDPTFQLIKFKDKPLKKIAELPNLVGQVRAAVPRKSVLKSIPVVRQQTNNGRSPLPLVANRRVDSAPPSPAVVVSDLKRNISIKSCPEIAPKSSRHRYPLGSTANPITLFQSGQTYHSQQPLSETQLQHISTILKQQKDKPAGNDGNKNYLIDPVTKTKIVYRVVYPEDEEDNDEDSNEVEAKKEPPKPKRPLKRARTKSIGKEIVETEEESLPAVVSNKKETKPEVVPEEKTVPVPSPPAPPPPPKVIKVPRTRSGRLSRPPRYMVRDYKRLPNVDDCPSKAFETDLYVDYKNAEEEVPPAEPIVPSISLEHKNNPSRPRMKKNFKNQYRCPTCQKIYLGNTKMMHHLRKFPDHGNLELMEIFNRASPERKPRKPLNIMRLKQLINGVDKSAYGPLLAKTFSLWDFLLVRVSLLQKNGMEEVEALLKELESLIEKLSKMADELLIPVFRQENDPSNTYVHVEKAEVANALGLQQGIYKVNQDRLNILRLSSEEAEFATINPPPAVRPPSKQSQLATKFEPNLSNKLMECSNDSIDLDSSSKDVEPEDDGSKKDWASPEKVRNSSEFLSEYLHNDLPSDPSDALNLWKPDSQVVHVSTQVLSSSENIWKDSKGPPAELELWKDSSEPTWKNQSTTTVDSGLWKSTDVVADPSLVNWREGDAAVDGVWKETPVVATNGSEGKMNWEGGGEGQDGKKDWLRQWKEGPGMRTTRLTSTPETQVNHGASAMFSPPLRRNSVSSFATSNQEELLSLDLNDLFDDLMPEQGKTRRGKEQRHTSTSTIESIINEALFTGTDPPTAHTTHALSTSLIPDPLDEVANLDFLEHD